MTSTRRQSASARAQRGAYAVEFAFVFLLSFALLYGAICYGMLFAFRLSLQTAAEDGAREQSPRDDQRDHRRYGSAACDIGVLSYERAAHRCSEVRGKQRYQAGQEQQLGTHRLA